MKSSGGSGGLYVEISSGSTVSKNVVSRSELALGGGSLWVNLETERGFEMEKEWW